MASSPRGGHSAEALCKKKKIGGGGCSTLAEKRIRASRRPLARIAPTSHRQAVGGCVARAPMVLGRNRDLCGAASSS